MNHLSLFSGMGGFDLAAERMGWNNVAHCEWNPFCQKILKYYWPKAISYADITKTDFSIHRGNIDIITGGFPCQPYSTAGLRKGKDDERHLWPHMLRAIREVKPRWVVGENVLGLVGWNGGLVFEEVQADLEAEGYEVQPYILPAASVNAPHQRYRVWFVAYCTNTRAETVCRQAIQTNKLKPSTNTKSKQSKWMQSTQPKIIKKKQGEFRRSDCPNDCRDGSDTYFDGESVKFCRWAEQCSMFIEGQNTVSGNWTNFPTQSPICNGDDGFSSRLDLTTIFEGFDKPLTFTKWRNESIKAGGNAIVHQVVLEIFKAILGYEKRI